MLGGLGPLVVIERPVIEDRAVLIHLDKRGAPMLGGGGEHLGEMLPIRVDGTSYEGAARPQRHCQRVERCVDRPIGEDFVTLPASEVGEY